MKALTVLDRLRFKQPQHAIQTEKRSHGGDQQGCRTETFVAMLLRQDRVDAKHGHGTTENGRGAKHWVGDGQDPQQHCQHVPNVCERHNNTIF